MRGETGARGGEIRRVTGGEIGAINPKSKIIRRIGLNPSGVNRALSTPLRGVSVGQREDRGIPLPSHLRVCGRRK